MRICRYVYINSCRLLQLPYIGGIGVCVTNIFRNVAIWDTFQDLALSYQGFLEYLGSPVF